MKEPRQLGRYFLTERIAKGGMAEVYRAKTVGAMGFLKDVAIKLILPEVLQDGEEHDILGMFIDEAHTASALEHPNIVRVHDLDQDHQSGRYFMAMDHIAGQNVRSLLTRSRPLSPHMSAYIIAEICGALGYAHRKTDSYGQPRNIVHRDVSPPNILISYEGEVKLIDFGVAKADDQFHDTADGALKGKYAYMSPEQTRSEPLDRRSDLFSLGTVLYEMLTGISPFRSNSILLTLQNVAEAPFARPIELQPSIAPELDDIVMRAMQRDRNARYPSAYEMQDALLHYLQSQSMRVARHHLSQWMGRVFAEQIQEEQRAQEAYAPYFQTLLAQRGQALPRPRGRSYADEATYIQTSSSTASSGWERVCTAQLERPAGEKPSYSGPFPWPVRESISYTGPAPTADRESLQAASEATSYAGPVPLAPPQEALLQAIDFDPSAPTSYTGPRPLPPQRAPIASGASWQALEHHEAPPTEMMPSLAPTTQRRRSQYPIIVAFLFAVVLSGSMAFWGWSHWAKQQTDNNTCQLQLHFSQAPHENLRIKWGQTQLTPRQMLRQSPINWRTPALQCGAQWLTLQQPGHKPYRRFLQLRPGTRQQLNHIALPAAP